MSTDRTWLQRQAKRVYDALCEAQHQASHLCDNGADDSERHFAHQVERDIEQLFYPVEHLMHEDDCE